MTDRLKFRYVFQDVRDQSIITTEYSLGTYTHEELAEIWPQHRIIEVLFSTGLRDKNGVLIFEDSDILRDDETGTLFMITRTRYSLMLKRLPVGYQRETYDDDLEHIEVIGNVHQHAHLLETT